jgi:hypothetical protein
VIALAVLVVFDEEPAARLADIEGLFVVTKLPTISVDF